MNDDDRPDRDNTTFVLFKDRHELRRALEPEDPPSAPAQAAPAPDTKTPEADPAKVIPIHRRILDLKKRSRIVRRAIAALPDFVTPNAVTTGRMLLAVPIGLLVGAKQALDVARGVPLGVPLDALLIGIAVSALAGYGVIALLLGCM